MAGRIALMPDGDPSSFTRVLYGCDADDVAEIVLMTPIKDWWETLKLRSDGVEEFNGFNRGFNGVFGGVEVSVFDSRVGSPVVLDCAYYLRFTPCRKIVFNGLIGALQPPIRVGDVIVPTAALRGEGASKYFVEELYPAVADFELLRSLASTLDDVYGATDHTVHYGPVYTTDAFAAETDEFLEVWRDRNLLGIEMETSVVYTIAALYGMKAVSFHVVSDNPLLKKSFFDPLTIDEKRRREECTELLFDALEKYVGAI